VIVQAENGGTPLDLSHVTLLCAEAGGLPSGILPVVSNETVPTRSPVHRARRRSSTSGLGDATSTAVSIVAEQPDEVDLRATSTGRAVLVLADTWYPGWSASVDGSPAQVLIADGFLRAVVLPKSGPHTVVFRYRPAVVWVGVYLSLFALGGVAAYGTARCLRRATEWS
jgi:hypothetical protein